MRLQSIMSSLVLLPVAAIATPSADAQNLKACQWGSAGYSWPMKTTNGTRVATAISGNVILYPFANLVPGKVEPVGNFWSSSGYNWVDDFNGDGFDDIASANGTTIHMRFQAKSEEMYECRHEVYNGQSTYKAEIYRLAGFQRDSVPVSGFWGAAGYSWTGDFDGDGRADIATASGNQVRIHFYDFTGYTEPRTQWLYDRDQDPIVFRREPSNSRCTTFADDYGKFVSQTWTVSGGWGASDYTWAADFDGDGKTDIATANGSNIKVHSPKGGRTGGFNSKDFSVPMPWGSGGYTWAADFNRDGKADIASANGGTVSIAIAQPVNQPGVLTGFSVDQQAITNWWGDAAYTFVEDFNGDGRADILSARGCEVKMSGSTGTGFAAPAGWTFSLRGSTGGSTGISPTTNYKGCGLGSVVGTCQ